MAVPAVQYGQYSIPTADVMVNFGVGQPAPSLLPLGRVRRAAAAKFAEEDPLFLQYGYISGYPAMRKSLAAFLAEGYGQRAWPRRRRSRRPPRRDRSARARGHARAAARRARACRGALGRPRARAGRAHPLAGLGRPAAAPLGAAVARRPLLARLTRRHPPPPAQPSTPTRSL